MLSDELLGRRVVVRYRRDDPDGRPPLSDLVGTLTALTADSVAVRGRTGTTTIDRRAVVAARPVVASRREVLELERISRRGWRGATQVALDGWLLSADQGWTGRANSALPLGQPSRSLDEQLAAVAAFYAKRGLEVEIQVPLPARRQLDVELARRGWTIARTTIMLTRPVPEQPTPPGPPGFISDLADEPDEAWLAGYHYRGGRLPEFARQLLTRHEEVTFASIRHRGRTVAIGRGVLDEGWLGVTAVDVAADVRRRGLARAIMGALFGWGSGRGARSAYLQVDEANHPALALYAGLGFTEHHRYQYRIPPAANPVADPNPAGEPRQG